VNGHGEWCETSASLAEPIELMNVFNICVIAAGPYHSALVDASGRVYTFGIAKMGRLGCGEHESRVKPTVGVMPSVPKYST
jgi:alpha-tubulin suppressor-like RCC1 family protein